MNPKHEQWKFTKRELLYLDSLDGCDVDCTTDPVDDKHLELLTMFPDGVPDKKKAALYRKLAKS